MWVTQLFQLKWSSPENYKWFDFSPTDFTPFLFPRGREQNNEGPKLWETGYKWEKQLVSENPGGRTVISANKRNHSCFLLVSAVQFNIITTSTVIHIHYESKHWNMRRGGKCGSQNINIITVGEKSNAYGWCFRLWQIVPKKCDTNPNPLLPSSTWYQHLLGLNAVYENVTITFKNSEKCGMKQVTSEGTEKVKSNPQQRKPARWRCSYRGKQ